MDAEDAFPQQSSGCVISFCIGTWVVHLKQFHHFQEAETEYRVQWGTPIRSVFYHDIGRFLLRMNGNSSHQTPCQGQKRNGWVLLNQCSMSAFRKGTSVSYTSKLPGVAELSVRVGFPLGRPASTISRETSSRQAPSLALRG